VCWAGEVALYAGVEPTPDAAGDVAALLALLSPPVLTDGPPVHLAELFDASQLSVFGATSANRCVGELMDREAYLAELEAVLEAMRGLEEIRPLIHRIRFSQSCLIESVEPTELARASFYDGVAAAAAGQEEAARQAFEEALAVDPTFPWDPNFPPDAELIFAHAAVAASQQAKTAVRVVAPTGAAVWLDGRRVESPYEGEEVPPGRHLVQVKALGEPAVRGVTVVTSAGGEDVLVVHPTALRSGVMAVEQTVEAARRLLGEMVQQDPASAPGHLVLLAPEVAVWRWDGAAGSLTRLESSQPPAEGTDTRRPRPSPAAPILLSAGAALAAAGGIVTYVATGDYNRMSADIEAGTLDYPQPDDPSPEDWPNYVKLQRKANTVYMGYGMLAVGGAAMVVSIPVGVATAARRQATIQAGYYEIPGDAGSGVERGFTVSFTVR